MGEIADKDALIQGLARLLKDREWQVDDVTDGYCASCGADISWLVDADGNRTVADAPLPRVHKSGCELAAALKDAGVDVTVEAANG